MIINNSILTDSTLARVQNSKTTPAKSPAQVDGPANGTTEGQESVQNDELQFSQVSGQWNAGGPAIQDSSTASAGMDFALAGMLNQPGATLLAHGNHQAQTVFQLLH